MEVDNNNDTAVTTSATANNNNNNVDNNVGRRLLSTSYRAFSPYDMGDR